MIIQCPDCSTGFNLPDKHITPKGAKLRCSKCSYVFRVRRNTPESEIEFFFKPEDEAANAARDAEAAAAAAAEAQEASKATLGQEESQAIELGADFEALLNSVPDKSTSDQDPATMELQDEVIQKSFSDMLQEESEAAASDVSQKTIAGAPNIATSERPGLSGYGFGSALASNQSAEDPFPLAGASVKKLKDKIKIDVPKPAIKPSASFSGSSVTQDEPEPGLSELSSPTEGIDLFGDELGSTDLHDDPFAGAFDDHEGLDPDSIAQEASEASAAVPVKEEVPILQPSQPAALHQQAAPQIERHQHTAAEPLNQFGAAPAAHAQQGDAFSSGSDDMLLGNSAGAFGDAGDFVDPSFGADVPSFDPQQGVVQTPAARPAQAAAQPAQRAQPAATQQPQVASAAHAATPSTTTHADDTWPSQADAIAAHRIGGGGMQKVANLLLIVLLVSFGFLGLVATLNGGLLDFKQFGSMIEVAFSDGEYKPREEWIPAPKKQPVPAMKDPLRTESVWAEVVPYGRKKQTLVVRGLLRNFDTKNYHTIELRGLILDKKEKIISEKLVTLGTLLSNDKIKSVKSVEEAQDMIPKSSAPLKVASSEPFTIVFDDVPEDVQNGEPIYFRVDVAKSTAE